MHQSTRMTVTQTMNTPPFRTTGRKTCAFTRLKSHAYPNLHRGNRRMVHKITGSVLSDFGTIDGASPLTVTDLAVGATIQKQRDIFGRLRPCHRNMEHRLSGVIHRIDQQAEAKQKIEKGALIRFGRADAGGLEQVVQQSATAGNAFLRIEAVSDYELEALDHRAIAKGTAALTVALFRIGLQVQ